MGSSEREKALSRLLNAAQHLGPSTLQQLAQDAEAKAEWEMAIAKARELAAKPHAPLGERELVGYDTCLAFAEKIGLRQQRASRFWSDLCKKGVRMSGRDKDHYQASQFSTQELRARQKNPVGLSPSDRVLLEVWLLNLS